MLRPEILVSPADRMSTYLALEQDTAEMCQIEAQTAIRRVYILLHLFFFFFFVCIPMSWVEGQRVPKAKLQILFR